MRLFMLLSCVALSATGLLAQDRPSVSVEASTYSQYVWRGLVLTDAPVLQTSSTAGYRGLHLNVFTNTDLGAVNQRNRQVSELDYDAGYDRAFEKVTLSGGAVHYTFPNTSFPSTTELYGGVGFTNWLHPSAKIYIEVGSIKGAYTTFDVSHAFVLTKPRQNMTWAAELATGVGAGSSGYTKGYFGVARTSLVDFHSTLSVPVTIGPHLRVIPSAGYASVLDAVLRQSSAATVHGFYCGLSISVAF